MHALPIKNARLQREQLEQGLKADLSNLWQAYQNNLQMLKLERQNLVAAKENHEIAMERYMLGNLSGIEMRKRRKVCWMPKNAYFRLNTIPSYVRFHFYKSVERSRNTWNRMGISEEWVG